MPIKQNSDRVRIYPSAPPIELNEEDVLDALSKEHEKAILKEINNMQLSIEHYKKLEHRYLIMERTLRSIGYVGVISLEIIAIGLQFTVIGLPISLLTGASGLAIPLLTEIILKLLNLKRQKYLKKISHIKEYLDRLYLFIQEAKEDKIISLEEITRFARIIEEFNIDLNAIDRKAQPDIENQLKMLSLEIVKISKLSQSSTKTPGS